MVEGAQLQKLKKLMLKNKLYVFICFHEKDHQLIKKNEISIMKNKSNPSHSAIHLLVCCGASACCDRFLCLFVTCVVTAYFYDFIEGQNINSIPKPHEYDKFN